MYYKPAATKFRRPSCMDEAVSLAQEWTDHNIDFVDQESDSLKLGIASGGLSFGRKSEGEGSPLTRRGMVTMLKKLHLPTSLSRIFDPEKEGSTTYTAEREALVDRGIDFINGLLQDLKTRLTLRCRDGYVRAVLGVSDACIDYDDGTKAMVSALSELGWKDRPSMFKEFSLSDSQMSIAITHGRVLQETEDRSFGGFKLTLSEDGEAKNDVSTYIWRKICSNGLMGFGAGQSGFVHLRSLRSNPTMAIMQAISSARDSVQAFATKSERLREIHLPRVKADERGEIFSSILGRLGTRIGLPRSTQERVLPVWVNNKDNQRSLFGLQNTLTAMGRDARGQERTMLERAGGRLVNLHDSALRRAVDVKAQPTGA